MTRREDPILWRTVDIPVEYCTTEIVEGAPVSFGGDIRIGDLRGTGHVDLLVYRSRDDAHDEDRRQDRHQAGSNHLGPFPRALPPGRSSASILEKHEPSITPM